MVARLMLLALLILAGCQTKPTGDFCDVSKPNRNPIADMTPAEARSALEYNLRGAALCGWSP